MVEHTLPANGAFCWNELGTTNLDAAKKFYTELLGWKLKDSNAAGMVYNEIVAGGREVGGMYQMTAEFGNTPSQWIAYVAVEDVDAKAKQVEELGGKVCVPPTDIPNVRTLLRHQRSHRRDSFAHQAKRRIISQGRPVPQSGSVSTWPSPSTFINF